MHSTSNSKVLVNLENLGLSFKMSFFRSDSFRGEFTNFFKKSQDNASRPDRLVLFENLNLTIYEGDRLGLVGVNGVGKTSLCRCIAGVYKPQKGKMSINGQVRAIFDTSIAIQSELTGRENAVLMSEFLYPHETDRKQMLEECLNFSELGEFLDVPVKFYSNGMNTRLALSVVSAKGGDILILDEVFEGADQFFRKKISERISKLIQSSGAAVFVSHSFEQIKKTCNRVVILSRNGIIFDGNPEEAEHVYKTKFGKETVRR